MPLISAAIPDGVLLSHLVFVVLVLALIFKNSWGRGLVEFVGKHAVALGLLAASLAVLGSLYYSNIVGYAPCELCWWQRIFIYPQVVLFLTALKYKDVKVFAYSVRLSVLSLLVALYQLYALYGGHSFLACTLAGGACAKNYVNAFGYISIPMMSLTISVYFLIIAYIYRQYAKNDSYA